MMMKALKTSLFLTVIITFALLMLLFFINTNRQYLLLIVVALMVLSYFVFKAVLKRREVAGRGKDVCFNIVLTVTTGLLISVIIIGIFSVIPG